MKREEIIKKLDSTILCLMAHPDNEPDSEFADRIDDLIDIKDSLLSKEPTIDDVFQEEEKCGKSNCNRPKLDGSVYCQYHYDINFG